MTNPSPSGIRAATNLAEVLDTGLDQKSIESIITLLGNGIHPDALAALILELRRRNGNAASTR